MMIKSNNSISIVAIAAAAAMARATTIEIAVAFNWLYWARNISAGREFM